MGKQQEEEKKSRLDDISTEWAIVRDPGRFVLRYASAIHRYVAALVTNRHDADEVAQEFFLRVTQHGFIRTRQEGGRFRDYLKAAVRNAALNFLRRNRAPKPADSGIFEAALADKTMLAADQAWAAEWRRSLLDRACRSLEKHQRRSPGNLFHTVLNMLVDNPLDDAETLAVRTSALIGRPLQPAAFRKQVSRARRMLARLLVQEVAQTLDEPTPEHIKEELIELALWEYVRGYLATDRQPPR
jgi:RNA polymerase sigma factor (sigma-70 family)